MLNKSALYKFMTTKQLNNCVDEIKMKLDKEQNFDKRLELLDKLATIIGVLLHRCRKEVEVVEYTMMEVNKLKTLVK